MALTILDSTVAAACAAVVSAGGPQTDWLDEFVAPWAGGNVTVRIYNASTLLGTVVVAPWSVSTAALPLRVVCGARVSWTYAASGTMTRIVFVAGATEIAQLTAGVGSGDVQFAGGILPLCAPRLAGVYVNAPASLPTIAPLTLQEVAADSMWTWFTDRRAVYNPTTRTYLIGGIKANGRVNVVEYSPHANTSTEVELTGAFQADDHNNPALLLTPDNRLWANYSKHNGDDFSRNRVSSAANSIAAFDAEVAFDAGGLVAYSNTHYLSVPGRYYSHYRLGLQSQHGIWSDDLETFTADGQWLVNGGNRPYVKSCSDGIDTIFLFFTSGHPNEVTGCSVYSIKVVFASDGSRSFYRLDDTLINTTGSVTPAQATLVWDGSTADGEAWTWEVKLGPDGHPRFLFARFPTPASDHRYMHARWTGSAIVVHEITDAGTPMYSGETYYTRGICFDGNDVTKLCLVKDVSGVGEVQEWRTADSGATWSKYRDITTGTSAGITWGRPYSCEGHDGIVQFLFWRGDPYTTFTDYASSMWAVGEA